MALSWLRSGFWGWKAYRVGLEIMTLIWYLPFRFWCMPLTISGFREAPAALVSVKLGLFIQENEGTEHKHKILLDFKSEFYTPTLSGNSAKISREKRNKKAKEVKQVRSRTCVCVCGRWLMKTRREGGTVLYILACLSAKNAGPFYGEEIGFRAPLACQYDRNYGYRVNQCYALRCFGKLGYDT